MYVFIYGKIIMQKINECILEEALLEFGKVVKINDPLNQDYS